MPTLYKKSGVQNRRVFKKRKVASLGFQTPLLATSLNETWKWQPFSEKKSVFFGPSGVAI
jgi:hypothetical protein